MSSARDDDASASTALPFADNPTDNPPARIEQLLEELSIQQAVLASLLDVPESSSTKEEIAAVKAGITYLRRQLHQAEGKGPSSSASMNNLTDRADRFGDYRTSTPTSNSNSMGSSPGEGFGLQSGIPTRKRSIGSSHLGIDPSNWGISKSRRASPSPALGGFSSGFSSGFGGFGSDDAVIDLTGDDDNEWRGAIQRQKEAEERAGRRKAAVDRDAALARQLDGRPSPSPSRSTMASSSQWGQSTNNAFDRILGRSSQTSPWTLGRTDRVKQELGPGLPTRPHASPKAEPSPFLGLGGDRRTPGSSTVKPESADYGYRNPAIYEDSDDESDAFRAGHSRQPFGTPSRSSRSSMTSLPSFGSTGPFPSFPSGMPTLPVMSQNLAFGQTGLGVSQPFRHSPGIPAIELARQASMARQGGSSAWPPVGPMGHLMHTPVLNGYPPSPLAHNSFGVPSLAADRPGLMVNGTFYPQSGPSAFPSLAATINRITKYDYSKMLDGDGNPLDTRLSNYIDDYVNDPRKTEADIQQLLSNIRPDMDIPEEERGETPEAMKYPLYVHQQVALKWMTDMEEGTNKGGILADDMGLGKTISTLALMVSRPSPESNLKTNLIIGPVSLIKQWELEIKKKLKGTHKLSVFLLHQKKKPYSELKKYDVVLTTYGSLAAEWKRFNNHVEQRKDSPRYEAENDMDLAKKCPLLHPRSKFYRVILDEAQYVKNKDTQGSKAVHNLISTYRWCLTGTPMMNGVSELYPLIRFLKIRPYCDFTTFQRAFKGLSPKSNVSDFTRDNAMRQLQAILKAMMLRRMKNSMIDGKPILTLPPKTETSEHVVFSEDERLFYQDLESRSQVQFNKFLRAGTVGKNYSNILVLLLRLRQACCHPHLTEFDAVGTSPSDIDMTALAKELDNSVVARIKAIEAFECPICYDGVQDPLLVIPCGHDTCTECFTSLTENAAQDNIRLGDENRAAKCPVCRGPVEPSKVITLTAFRKVHAPEALGPEAADEELPPMSDSEESDDSSSDDDAESDADSLGSLAGFVVPDEEEVDEDAELDAELDAAAQAATQATASEEAVKPKEEKRSKKHKKRSKASKAEGKAKAKPEEIKPHMLKQLRNDAYKNKEASRRYMHYLRDNWEDSAKVTEVVRLLEEIQQSDEKTIIFSQWTSLLDLIECQIKYKLHLRFCRYTGKMTRNHRDEAVQDFVENPRNKVMLVSLRAGNAGLNLTAASRIIICDPFWNPFTEMQAVDRAHRIGQQREVKVHRILVKETIEDRILSLQESKRRLVEAALDEGQSKSLGRLSERELAYLFGVNPARR